MSRVYLCQRLASRLESEPTMLNAAEREDLQRTASYDGNVMQQIGALLLELGRATLSLRMGQSPVRFWILTLFSHPSILTLFCILTYEAV